MSIKVTNTGGVKGTGKKSKARKAQNVDGPSFASMVDQASKVSDVEAASSVSGVNPVTSPLVTDLGEDIPQEARQRGAYMLDQLEELEQDILTGNPTIAIEKLKAALGTEALGRGDLPAHVQALLDEIDMRVNVEIAKLEEGNKKQD